ncbi:MAG: hypothetical protein G01um101429_205 [Parcubacteria group bacterium Gr01-1014_29]|nr:MAG: hypothetical protein G01um101429_205 [Parcubacteria group bacterium Gr01-1014_29]
MTDFEKIKAKIDSLEEPTYRRVVKETQESLLLACLLWQRNIEFVFKTATLLYIRVFDRGKMSAEFKWSGQLVGVMIQNDIMELYQDSDGFARIDLENGILSCS